MLCRHAWDFISLTSWKTRSFLRVLATFIGPSAFAWAPWAGLHRRSEQVRCCVLLQHGRPKATWYRAILTTRRDTTSSTPLDVIHMYCRRAARSAVPNLLYIEIWFPALLHSRYNVYQTSRAAAPVAAGRLGGGTYLTPVARIGLGTRNQTFWSRQVAASAQAL